MGAYVLSEMIVEERTERWQYRWSEGELQLRRPEEPEEIWKLRQIVEEVETEDCVEWMST